MTQEVEEQLRCPTRLELHQVNLALNNKLVAERRAKAQSDEAVSTLQLKLRFSYIANVLLAALSILLITRILW